MADATRPIKPAMDYCVVGGLQGLVFPMIMGRSRQPDIRPADGEGREHLRKTRGKQGLTPKAAQNPAHSADDIQFAYRLAESTSGRVFFTAGKDLDRYVVWDYVNHRRTIVA